MLFRLALFSLWLVSFCLASFTNPIKAPNGSDPFMVRYPSLLRRHQYGIYMAYSRSMLEATTI